MSAMFLCFFAQAQVSGKVMDNNGNPLIGATVVFVGTSTGTITDVDGSFTLNGTGDAVEISYVGYANRVINLNGATTLGDITLESGGIGLDEIVVTGVLDIVTDRSTPVAVSNISARDIQLKLGNQEFPEIMKTTPSIYVTKQGGGYGDARINVRGFDQSNTSYIINGQPVNDMENGWVYWSNWAGLQDIASAIQIQRGMGASRLAVPSVGGTVNIVTKSTDREQGGFVSAGVGNDGYLKTTVSYGTGEMDNGFSASMLLGRWQGDGYVDGTQGEGYNYLAAVGYNAGNGHKFNASFLGAGQWHHQRSLWLSIRDYETFGGDDKRRYNGDWGMLNGEEYTFRRNFYNKPIASINWDWEISDKTSIGAVLYGSWGRGGGTGPRGRNFGIYPFREDMVAATEDGGLPYRTSEGLIDFDAVVANNMSGTPYTGSEAGFAGGIIGANSSSLGGVDGINTNIAIRRSSINSHDWYGAIVNLKHKVGDLTLGVGLDSRTYSGIHYRIVNDLLGLDGYAANGNSNDRPNLINTTADARPFVDIDLDDKINYYNIGNVGWLGVNGLAEYETETISGVLQVGVSNQSYQREDFFRYSGDEQQSDTHTQLGGFVKGGLSYKINNSHVVFANAGQIWRQPNFDAIFPNFANNINPDIENEEITSFELGYGYNGDGLDINVNAYTTSWGNRFISRGFTLDNGADGTANFANLKNIHSGIEIEADYELTDKIGVSLMTSLNDWTYNGDVDATVFDDDQNQIGSATLYLSDVKVGDAAQTTLSLGLDYEVMDGLRLDATYFYFDNLFADFAVTDDEFITPNNRGAVKLPSYGLLDLGATYNVKLGDNLLTLRANINNLLDTEYIAESNTNIHAESGDATYEGVSKANYIWWGFGRTWNFSAKYSF